MLTQQPGKSRKPKHGQDPSGGPLSALQLGDQVRISGKSTGKVMGIDNTGLQLLERGFVPYSEMTKLEVKTGVRSRWKGGLLVGVAVVLAYALVLFLTPDRGGYNELVAVMAIVGGCPVGAALGAIDGAFVRTDAWKTVQLG